MSTTATEIAKLLLEIKAVSLNAEQPFRYTSGLLSPIYCDNRLIISHPQKRKQVINAFLSVIQPLSFDVVAGVATAGIPHAAWIAEALNKPMIYVRDKSKSHGKQNQIEGRIEQGQTALVVEDLISTGGSSVAAAIAIREAGATVKDCVAIFSYTFQSSLEKFKDSNIKLHTLTQLSTLLDVGVIEGYISSSDKEKIAAWQKDPQNWS